MLARRAALLALALLFGCDDSAVDPSGGGAGGDAAAGGGEGGGIPAEEDPFEPPPAPTPLSDAELAALQSDIDAALATASATYSALVVGLDTGQLIYERAPDTARKPASNTKLFTTAAALVREGESGRP